MKAQIAKVANENKKIMQMVVEWKKQEKNIVKAAKQILKQKNVKPPTPKKTKPNVKK